uniref:PRONE domain-containing protein n=1 Tax=Kalanchoe fedtschenkoi TaxID=63787 RepID=A0A7N0UA53_KALFE
MAEIRELATRMELAGAGNGSDSASDFSAESGGGASSRFSSFAASEDGDAKGASSLLPGGISEIDTMKERFAKLLLGEDMSGGGKGVSTALAISNAITNLFASIFGQLWRLEPLPLEKKEMWRREMGWILSVTDHIIEMVPAYKIFPDGTKLEELLDGFGDTEFWYVDKGKSDVDTNGSALFDKSLERQKWWLPVPRTPADGLSADSRTQLQRRRECAKQILKAAMTINTDAILDMEVPDSYLESLPKTGRACLGDSFYRFVVSDHFSVESLFDCLDLSADLVVLELVNRLEAAVNLWRKKSHSHVLVSSNCSTTKSSSTDAERREFLAGRAEDLLLALKQKFPNLCQTTLEATKIQFNKDVGKSILESYSRVLESLAHTMIARIDDLLSIDELTDHPETYSSLSSLLTPARQTASSPHTLSLSNTPTRTPPATPHFSATPLLSPAKSEIAPFLNKLPRHSNRAKRVLACYMCREPRRKSCHSPNEYSPVLAISNPVTDTGRPPSHPNRAHLSQQNS